VHTARWETTDEESRVNASIDAEVARLRWRAAQLVEAAGRIEAVALEAVHLRAGADTWRGPTAVAFIESVTRARLSRDAAARHVRTAASQLVWQAERLREEQLRAGLRS
jgi:hypothetical protein